MAVLPDVHLVNCKNIFWIRYVCFCKTWYTDWQSLLPRWTAIWRFADEVYIFHQDNTPAHYARHTVELLCHETLEFIAPDTGHITARTLIWLITAFGEWCRNEYQMPLQEVAICSKCWWACGLASRWV